MILAGSKKDLAVCKYRRHNIAMRDKLLTLSIRLGQVLRNLEYWLERDSDGEDKNNHGLHG